MPLIFDIKRHALKDGPGIRTTVFFKGCNMRCVWCQNPESIDSALEIAFTPSQCINCGACERACRFEGVCSLNDPLRINREECVRCADCVRACPGRGLRVIGRYYSVDELLDILLRDITFYQTSGGGVTFSGGEPTLDMEYLSIILRKLKEKGINTAVQTNGKFPWEKFKTQILDFLDIIMIDLKLADPNEHLKYTGSSNKQIFENLDKLFQQDKVQVVPRIPLIPVITATEQNLKELASMLRKYETPCVLLPYNPMGLAKYKVIGKEIPCNLPDHMMDIQEERRYKDFFKNLYEGDAVR